MTEMVNGESQNFQSSAPAVPVTPSSTPSQAPSDERTFRQSEVNDLVGRAKHEAIERYKRETSMPSHSSGNQPNYGYAPPQQPNYQQPQQPQYQGMSEQEARRIAKEEATQSRNDWIQEQRRSAEESNAQRIASEFFTKVGSGEGGMQEFEKLVGEAGIDLRSIPYHVQLSNMVDNTREVMVDLIRNPSKIGAIQNLIDIDLRAGRQPSLALAEIKRLSESIKSNQKASKFEAPNDPLSQMRPTNTGTGNAGALSVSDYKRKYRV
jgi:hypothetical protein